MKASITGALMLSIILLNVEEGTAQKINGLKYKSLKKVQCSKAAVVSAHPLASKAGIRMLQQGGNAIDAAIATQLALAVVYPGAGNIGGGGFMVAHLKNGRNITIDYRETAPAASGRDMYLDSLGSPLMDLSQEGHLASGVPGTIAGLFASLKYGRLPFKKLVQPAIDLAETVVITSRQAEDLNELKNEFERANTTLFCKKT
ncbi:MAG: gamma-glutamyltransferase [Ferruginibacter sp.]